MVWANSANSTFYNASPATIISLKWSKEEKEDGDGDGDGDEGEEEELQNIQHADLAWRNQKRFFNMFVSCCEMNHLSAIEEHQHEPLARCFHEKKSSLMMIALLALPYNYVAFILSTLSVASILSSTTC